MGLPELIPSQYLSTFDNCNYRTLEFQTKTEVLSLRFVDA